MSIATVFDVAVPVDFVEPSACPDGAVLVFKTLAAVVFKLLMIKLLACMVGAVLSGDCGRTMVHPAMEGLDVH